MLEFDLSREHGRAVLRLVGDFGGVDDVDVLGCAFALLQPGDRLIVDLTEISEIDFGAALLLRDVVTKRALSAETVVVSPCLRVSMQLVLHDVDRASPIVPSLNEAFEILDAQGPSRHPSLRSR